MVEEDETGDWEDEELNKAAFALYVSYACRALLGGGKGQHVMSQLREDNPQLYGVVMTLARERLYNEGLIKLSEERG